MEVGSISSAPRTVEEIFKDYSSRRAGIVRALTHGSLPLFFPLALSDDVANVGVVILSLTSLMAPCWSQMSTSSTPSAIPVEKENLCLYGHPNDSWEVNLPAEEVPPELPEPALGINFARDGMNRRDWLSLIAVHSDSWLLSVAFYLGARLNRNERYGFNSKEQSVEFLLSLISLCSMHKLCGRVGSRNG
ncbi:hypothetical protein B296_00006423 [Ensete ventricosum]|uniref:PHD finger protein ALFIN-LIKE n=1 Tax=Ensete ventricosum TaxID=4639 RepID=A0A426Z6Y2_ENSVE|nr:hypothetical protein B296_00006423 [Ensete ventricosum]